MSNQIFFWMGKDVDCESHFYLVAVLLKFVIKPCGEA